MQVETQIKQLNKQAMDELREENYNESFRNLSKALDLLQKVPPKNINKLQAITYNNLGCFYKATGKGEVALNYLQKALSIEKTADFDPSNLAGTHLNICAIYSQKNNHEKALTHAITALKLLRTACANGSSKNVTTLIIALHNTGIEYESIGNIEKAASTFKYGLELAQQFLGNKHQFTIALLKSFLAITTTEKKYYFEKSNLREKTSNKRPEKNYDMSLPKVSRISSQENSPANRLLKEEKNAKNRKNLQTAEENVARQELPIIEKPHTFGGRSKKSGHNEYVNSLEEKINFLQSQLMGFEKRYKDLEDLTGKTPKNIAINSKTPRNQNIMLKKRLKEKAAILIQKHWRGFLARKDYEKLKQTVNRKTIIKDINFLEQMKKNQKKILSPKPMPKSAFSNFGSKNSDKLRRYSLHPITETKFETKSQKAILIQSHIRKFIQRRKYLRLKAAINLIKNHYKTYMHVLVFPSKLCKNYLSFGSTSGSFLFFNGSNGGS